MIIFVLLYFTLLFYHISAIMSRLLWSKDYFDPLLIFIYYYDRIASVNS